MQWSTSSGMGPDLQDRLEQMPETQAQRIRRRCQRRRQRTVSAARKDDAAVHARVWGGLVPMGGKNVSRASAQETAWQ
jgi:hypothetical protein